MLTLQTKEVAIAAAASGANAIVAAVSGKKIRVLGLLLSSSGIVNAKWQSAASDKTGLTYMIASTSYVLPVSHVGWFETNVGEALNLNLSAAIAVGGVLVYQEIIA